MDTVYIVRDGEKLYVFTTFEAACECADDMCTDPADIVDYDPQDEWCPE